MNNIHLKLVVSALDKNSLQDCLNEIICKLNSEELGIVYHDDYQYSFEVFDNETLKIFEVDPNNFIFENLPNL
jgi:hypothetical protein